MKKIKNKIFFRADGSPAIGLGHLVRSLALAQMLEKNFEISFCCKEAPESFVKDLAIYGFQFLKIDSENQWINLINDGNIAVIDHYKIGIETHSEIKAKGAKVVCIDDMHDKPFDADLIINQAPGVKKEDYQAKDYTQFALGPKYALLRPEFLVAASNQHLRKHNRNLLICFGGADFNNLSCQAIKALSVNDYFEQIIVITGSSYSFRDELSALVLHDKRVHWYENRSADEMLHHMLHCYYALAPASSIAYEILAAGCIWLGGYYVDNQRNIYEGFRKMNCMIDLGDLNINIQDKLQKFNPSDLKNQKDRNIIDGKSKERLNTLMNITFKKNLTIN